MRWEMFKERKVTLVINAQEYEVILEKSDCCR